MEAPKAGSKDQLQVLTDNMVMMGECLNQLSKGGGKAPGGGKAKGGKGTCHICGEAGHLMASCPKGFKGGNQGGGKGKGGAKAGKGGGKGKGKTKGGHKGQSTGKGAGFGFWCYGCGEEGHIARNCAKARLYEFQSDEQENREAEDGGEEGDNGDEEEIDVWGDEYEGDLGSLMWEKCEDQ